MKRNGLLIIAAFIYSCFISTVQITDGDLTISGKVTDEYQNPVKGVTVFVDNVKNSTVTDENGRYTVIASPHSEAIIFFALDFGASKKVN